MLLLYVKVFNQLNQGHYYYNSLALNTLQTHFYILSIKSAGNMHFYSLQIIQGVQTRCMYACVIRTEIITSHYLQVQVKFLTVVMNVHLLHSIRNSKNALCYHQSLVDSTSIA